MIDRIAYTQPQYMPGVNLAGGRSALGGVASPNQVGLDLSAEKVSGSRSILADRGMETATIERATQKNSASEKMLKQTGQKECETCKERTYQDGSNDPGVSFKAPTHISPENAGAAVAAHEGEHVQRERAKAGTENKEVIAQSVRVYTSVCPECGKSYVAGGETVTTTRTTTATTKAKPYEPGQNIDLYA
ncbi:MAG: hypothetical protein CVU90_14885 [Firmicutes bacterium HGW-Firmicutes-15]|nr:MAG: hypothetical protein CVU90_14885 [Firmicutes bacterium HGW-Firmicutes-15]